MSKPDQTNTAPALGTAPDPAMLEGMMVALQHHLSAKQADCVAAIGRLIGVLEVVAEEPSAGLTDEIIAELAAARQALGAIQSGDTASAEELAAVARRLSLLAQTYAALDAADVGHTVRPTK